MKTIAVLTSGRQDWGILHSTCVAIQGHDELRLRLLIGGMHLSERHGYTVDLIRDDGFDGETLDWLRQAGDGPEEPTAQAQAAAALALVGDALASDAPDALLLVGDRLETAAAALAATVTRVPIAHLHGGEQTLGAFDDALRHAVTKLSHLHLVSHEEHARRVIALGENPSTVHVVGAPGLDAAVRSDLPDRAALEGDLGLELRSPVVIVTVHPATLDDDPGAVADVVASAMDEIEATYVVTLPNVDPGADHVRTVMTAAAARPGRVAVDALGERRYWGLMRIADAMLGNSSSALVEAPAVDLPAVDVGDRQAGRRREANVIGAPMDPGAVGAALRRALDPTFRATVVAAHPDLADGRAGARVADIMAVWRPPHPPRKPPIQADG